MADDSRLGRDRVTFGSMYALLEPDVSLIMLVPVQGGSARPGRGEYEAAQRKDSWALAMVQPDDVCAE